MIPLRISIQNFLSYGSPVQTIHFNYYKLICLSGKNGHGKSALLDAMTWALWGQARKTGNTSKADAGIVKLGQTDVMVIFDFSFNQQTYRVKRVFSTKYGKPKAHIDFGTYNPETDYFSALTEKTIRKTQECINTTLGLDYEGFINSSFLRQGQANEFSKKSPKERKEVLATILGLDRYEKAKKVALETMRKVAQEKEQYEKLALHLAKDNEYIPELEKQLIQAQTELKKVLTNQQELTKKNTTLEIERKKIEQKEQEKKLLIFESQQKELEQKKQTELFKQHAAKWRNVHSQLLALPEKNTLEKQYQSVTVKLNEYQEQIKAQLILKEELLKQKSNEQEILHKLTQETATVLQNKQLEVERLKAHCTLETNKLETCTKELTALTTQQKSCEIAIEKIKKTVKPARLIGDTQELRKNFDRYKSYYHKWIEQGNWAANELKSLTEKQRLSQDSNHPSCPLCEQNLSQARKRFLYKKFTDQETFLKHRLQRLKKLITHAKESLKEQHATLEASTEIDQLFKKYDEFIPAVKEKEKEKQQQKQIARTFTENYQKALIFLEKEKKQTEQSILQNSSYKEIKQKRETVEKKLKAHAPQKTFYNQLLEEQKNLTSQLEQHKQFEQEQTLQKERKNHIAEISKTIKELKKEQTLLIKKLEAFKKIDEELTAILKQQSEISAQINQCNTEKERLLEQKGGLENQQQKLQEQAQQQKKYAAEAKKQEITVQHYKAVAQALSKDGIQALLIEDALPEIEQEANDLLARLTDNQTHIFIESLRDLKKGGTRETLDINISDSSGIRPYEMFSGGEAFRLDFALRIAISKLLARRSGTSLQTLIIDEGFGSQDEEGLQKIMDVLYKIQDDFEKIIIVSHLGAMKDQFPVHFVVTKGPQGSHITIKEQG
jgi:exonuclease SbcC